MQKKFTLVFLLLLGAIIFSTTSVTAEEPAADELPSETAGQSALNQLDINPKQLHFGLLEPGHTYTQSFTICNASPEFAFFDLSLEPFGVQDGSYEEIYTKVTEHNAIIDWTSFVGNVEYALQPTAQTGECVELSVRVRVPSDAPGGSQYAAIMLHDESSESDSIQTLPLYATINQGITYRGAIVDQNITSFSFSPVIYTSSTIENHGNADFPAVHRLTIEPFFGGETVYENTQEKTILPSTHYNLNQNWDDTPTFGVFRVTQEITYVDEHGESVIDTFKRTVIICPLWLVAAVVAALILVFATIIALKKKHGKKHSKKPSWEQEG